MKDGEEVLCVDPLDTQAMAKAILKLLKDRTLHHELSQKGYERAHSMFTWQMIAEKTLELIKQL